jgi:putative oxidoreductase
MKRLDAIAPTVLPTAARLVFAATLLVYFWSSALTKVGPGLFTPSDGAFVQIFPRAMEAAGYDSSALGLWPTLVVLAGTWGEFLLPALIVAGLFTRLAALGMIGFVVMQSLTDIVGHGAGAETIGRWFDRLPDAVILDQRAFWVLLLVILVLHGSGPLGLDRLLRHGPLARLAA